MNGLKLANLLLIVEPDISKNFNFSRKSSSLNDFHIRISASSISSTHNDSVHLLSGSTRRVCHDS